MQTRRLANGKLEGFWLGFSTKNGRNPGEKLESWVSSITKNLPLGGVWSLGIFHRETHCSKETGSTKSDLELKRLCFFSESLLLIKDFPKISFTSL